MATAAEVVALQASLLDEFRTPDPQRPHLKLGVRLGSGDEYVVPVSKLGIVVDTVFYGEKVPDMRVLDRLTEGRYDGSFTSVAPIVADGLVRGRTYRVAENMTPAVVERADALPADTRFGYDITPPRAAGFAWFDELVPYYPHDDGKRLPPGTGAISWNLVAGGLENEGPTEAIWVVIAWDDLARSPWTTDTGAGYRHRAPGARFVPIAGMAIDFGDRLKGTPLPAKRLGEQPMRSPLHVVAALWQLLGETVPAPDRDHVEQSAEGIDRRARRRATTAGMTDRTEVTTVVLRRVKRPVQHPGSGQPHTSRIKVAESTAWRWIGPRNSPDRRRVRVTVREHWSCKDESLPVRNRKIVSELRR